MFGIVTKSTAFDEDFDAVIGMAYPEFAFPDVVPFFDGLMASNIMKKNVFAFHMSMNPEDEDSEMLLGDWDESKFTGSLEWYDVVNRRFWSIALDDILIGGNSLGFCTSDKSCLLTPDSGTTGISFPSWAFNRFIEDYGDVIDCEPGWESDQGDITFVINGKNYSLPSHHWNYREASSTGRGGKCSTSVTDLDFGYEGLADLFIVGDMFMSMYYTVFSSLCYIKMKCVEQFTEILLGD